LKEAMMTRQAFDQELQRLEDEVLAMGSMVGAALIKSVEFLKKRDLPASRALVLADREINERRFSLEEDVLTLIATQQPMARDMRLLAAILEIPVRWNASATMPRASPASTSPSATSPS
jgi:phosphate transport system protein